MTPRATYRLQFTPDFGFDDAAALAPYLARLGVSHVYCSPVFIARPGSRHGYDVTDPTRLNPELGDEAAFRAMAAAFRAEGLGLVLDIVPNHMGVGGETNDYWLDVLAWGPESRYAGWFDIDWESAYPGLRGKLLVPVLSEGYGTVLSSGDLGLRLDGRDGRFAVWAYGSHKLPVCPRHYGRILRAGEHEDLAGMADLLASATPDDPGWARLFERIAREAEELGPAIAAFRGRKGDRGSWHRLDALIAGQSWWPARYSLADDAINYRRFFTITELAGLRIEDEAVFEATHGLVLRLLEDGVIEGLRIDHIDGLRDPKAYVARLRARSPNLSWLLVEKILALDERLPEGWVVDGTTGYEVANLLVGLLVDPAGTAAMTEAYHDFIGRIADPAEVVRQAKREVMERTLRAEVEAMTARLLALAASNPRYRDLGRAPLQAAFVEIVAALDVYRTYVDAEGMSTEDRARLRRTVDAARRGALGRDPATFDFVERVLSLEAGDTAEVKEAALRAQQLSGPAMAKGLEDAALYRYNRLIALNEVGSHPGDFFVPQTAFHAANLARQAREPRAMLTTSTHDTKLGEDARARIAALGSRAERWGRAVAEWHAMLDDPARSVDPNEAYFFFQLLIGAWPAEWRDGPPSEEALAGLAARVRGAMLKSIREAGINTRWTFGAADYEAAFDAYVSRGFDRTTGFLASFQRFEAGLATDGAANALIQTALKLTIPGVPDIYQGAELWEQSLVDPDNRRAVDFAARARLLESADPSGDWTDPAVKLAVVHRLLRLRAERPRLFAEGSYEPLSVAGPGAARVLAFARRRGAEMMVVAAELRHAGELPGAATRIGAPEAARGPWRDVLTGDELEVMSGAMFARLPVAVLTETDAQAGHSLEPWHLAPSGTAT